jgi:hypothetical protein
VHLSTRHCIRNALITYTPRVLELGLFSHIVSISPQYPLVLWTFSYLG